MSTHTHAHTRTYIYKRHDSYVFAFQKLSKVFRKENFIRNKVKSAGQFPPEEDTQRCGFIDKY